MVAHCSRQHNHRRRIIPSHLRLPLQLQHFSVESSSSSSEPNSPDNDKPTKKVSATKAYAELSKAKLSALVVTTTAAGFMAAGGPLSTMGACCVGTALCSSSAAAWNQIFERDRDAKMKRTQQRPLVQNDISVPSAVMAATTWGIAGTSLLAYGTDPYTAALGLSNIVLYAGVYTYTKPRSVLNTWVGAVVGAIPPIMGWSAATGGNILDVEALLLGTTLYLWQMPHFFALSYMHRIDYGRGGFKMVPVLEPNGERTAQLIVRYAWYLSTVPVVSTLTGVTSSMFALEGFVLNGYALYVAHQFQQDRTNAKARKVFLTSLWYLPSFLVLFLLHSKTWDQKNSEDNVLREIITKYLQQVREQGKKLCLHETAVLKAEDSGTAGEKACPVTMASKTGEGLANEAVVKTAGKNLQGQS